MFSRLLDFLLSLDRVHLGSSTRFGFVWNHPVLITLAVLALLGIGYASYLPQSASPIKKRLLGILRATLLALVLLLACRPQLVMEHEDRQPSVVAVWVDSSASMTLEDPYTGAGDAPMRAYMEKVTAALQATATAPLPGTPAADAHRIDRYRLATATLADAQWLRELTETQQILFFTGSGRAEPVGLATTPAEVDARIAQLRTAKPQGGTTDVPTVVRDILERVQGQRLSAIVLLTDGQTTETGTRLDEAAELAALAMTPVFPLPLGQKDEPFDLQIANLRLPINTFSRDPVAARIRISAAGLTGPLTTRVNIYRRKPDGTVDTSVPLATREITLNAEQPQVDLDIPIRLKKTDPGKSERFDLVARLEPPTAAGIPEERTLVNNERSRTVTVLDAQINVLYVEGYPRWEFRYLKNELLREPTVNLSTLLITADEGFVQDADPAVHDKITGEETFPGALLHFPDNAKDLARYDVLLLGDVEPTYFSPMQQSLIIDWVKTRGGGLGLVAGNLYNPETYRQTPLEVLLPVTPDEVDPRARIVPPSDNSPYTLMLTPAGKETNLFRFFDDPEESWKQVANLPDMYWFKPVQGLKPGAIVLATNSRRSTGGTPAPMLVMRQFGAGPVLFAAYSDSWRWRRYTGEPLFQSYWLQLCRLLYANKAMGQSKRIEMTLETPQVEIGGQIKLSLTVKDPTLGGQIPAEAQVMIVDKEGRTVQTLTLSHPPGDASDKAALEKLTGAATAGQLGDFELRVKPGTLPVEVAPLELTVRQPQREFQSVTADLASLESLARKTAGKVVRPDQSPEILPLIPDRSMMVLQSVSEELWNKPIALILVLLIATAEWLLRKSAGLI